MADYTVKTGQTFQAFQAQIKQAGVLVDLSGATLNLIIQKDASTALTFALTVTALGTVQHLWTADAPSALPTEALYPYCRIEGTAASGAKIIAPSDGWLSLDFQGTLG